MILDCFKVPLYNTVFDHLDGSSMIDYCYNYSKEVSGVQISNDIGYQSPPLNGEHMPLNELFKEIDYTANAVAQRLGLKMPTYIDSIWININKPGATNMEHRHPKTMLSGVFYLSVPQDSGRIVFTNPISNLDMIWTDDYVDTYTPYNSECHYHTPVNNEIVIFPSWLSHKVERNNSNSDRISIAFNCRPINL